MYLGISPSKFDELVNDGRMPRPRIIDSRKVWDVYELDMAFDELPREDGPQSPVARGTTDDLDQAALHPGISRPTREGPSLFSSAGVQSRSTSRHARLAAVHGGL